MSVAASCAGCTGQCCHQYRVAVNGSDAHRLSRGLLAPIETFAAFITVEPGEKGALRLDGGETRHSLHLRRRDDGGCSLLVGLLDGTERCGVYGHRPTACRVYPVTRRGAVALRDDIVCPPWDYCGFFDVPIETWLEALDQSEAEWELYDRVTAVWDAGIQASPPPEPVAPEAFVTWMTEVYRRLEELPGEPDPDVAAAVAREVSASAG